MKEITIEELLAICQFTGGKPETITYEKIDFVDREKMLKESSLLVGTFQVTRTMRVREYLSAYASIDPVKGNAVLIMDDLLTFMPTKKTVINYTCFTFVLPEDHILVIAHFKQSNLIIPLGPFRSSEAKRFTVFVPMYEDKAPQPFFFPFSLGKGLGVAGISFSFGWV